MMIKSFPTTTDRNDRPDPIIQLFLEESIEISKYFRGKLLNYLNDPNAIAVRALAKTVDYIEFIKDGAAHFGLTEHKIAAQNLESLLRSLQQETRDINAELIQTIAQADRSLWRSLLHCHLPLENG